MELKRSKLNSNEIPMAVAIKHLMGSPAYTINFDVQEVTDENDVQYYSYFSIEFPSNVWDYGAIVDAIVTTYYPSDKMQAVINNCLQNLFNVDALQDYLELQ